MDLSKRLDRKLALRAAIVILAMSVPFWINIFLGAPLDAKTILLIESILVVMLGLSRIYITRDVAKYSFMIKEQTKLQQESRRYVGELEHYIKFKELFTDILTHDLMNPAVIVKNYVDLLLEKERDKERRSHLKSVKRNAEKLVEIIQDSMKLAEIKSMGKIEFVNGDLNVVLGDVIGDVAPLIQEKKMEIDYDAKSGKRAQVNPVIEHVFSNLISNAVKYGPEGSKIVLDVEDEGENWKVMVKDYGTGIPDEYKEGIFERFKRTQKRGIKGTGLGLAIAKGVVGLHHGEIWVEDNPDGGSIFYVRIPKKQ